MERDEQQLTGWRKFRFNYGSLDSQRLSDIEIADRSDQCCTQEQCGSGCYVATVDYDRLDWQ